MLNTFDPFNFPFASKNFLQWAPEAMSAILGVSPDIQQEDIIIKGVKLNGDRVLIIGGGPSSQKHFDEIDNYYSKNHTDVWSMNHFYKSSRLSTMKVDLLSVGAGVNLEDPEFLEYCNNFNPQLAFEIHPDWVNVKLPDDAVYYHTKIYGKIGVGVRLINLAAALGARQIDFIGLDGPEAIIRGEHSFEPGKKALPSYVNSFNASFIHEDQYLFFWDYIRKLYPAVIFNSIDKTNKYHMPIITDESHVW